MSNKALRLTSILLLKKDLKGNPKPHLTVEELEKVLINLNTHPEVVKECLNIARKKVQKDETPIS